MSIAFLVARRCAWSPSFHGFIESVAQLANKLIDCQALVTKPNHNNSSSGPRDTDNDVNVRGSKVNVTDNFSSSCIMMDGSPSKTT